MYEHKAVGPNLKTYYYYSNETAETKNSTKEVFVIATGMEGTGSLYNEIADYLDSKGHALYAIDEWQYGKTGEVNKKHVYKNWTPIMNKVGAFNPLFDPFKMEINKDIIPDYKEDSCPATLDHLAKTVYVAINPNWTEEQYQAVLTALKNAK